MSGSLFTLAMARLVLKMLGGELIPYTKFDGLIANRLMDEGIITIVPRGSKRSFRMIDPEGCRIYISQNYTSGMELEDWIEMKNCPDEVLRSEQVAKAGDSKLRYTRTFKGFLLNCYTPIEATFHGEPCVLSPLQGTSIFMQDYEYFRIPEDVVVVGIENGENFQHIRAQKYLFEGMKVLFVSRYPQSKDLCNWLKIIPNRYIHFGDIDLAGISIFLNEFYVKLGNRAEFFIPADVKKRLKDGNRQLYDNQYLRYRAMLVSDERLRPLVAMIHKYGKAYEQEGYISNHTIFRHANFIGCLSADKIKMPVRKYFCFNIPVYRNMAEEPSCRSPYHEEYIQTSVSGNSEGLCRSTYSFLSERR